MHYIKSAIIEIGEDAMTLPGDYITTRGLRALSPAKLSAAPRLTARQPPQAECGKSFRKAKSICPRTPI